MERVYFGAGVTVTEENPYGDRLRYEDHQSRYLQNGMGGGSVSRGAREK